MLNNVVLHIRVEIKRRVVPLIAMMTVHGTAFHGVLCSAQVSNQPLLSGFIGLY